MPESRISLPADVTDALSLRRTLSAIIDQINIIIGAKGVDPYVKESDLPEAEVTLDTLNSSIAKLTDSIAEVEGSIEDYTEELASISTQLQQLSNVLEYAQGPSALQDFNDTGWNEVSGHFQFSGTGLDFTNTPEVLDDVKDYILYSNSVITLGGGITQELVVENTTDSELKVYRRAANSFAQLLVNGWFNVQSY